MCSTDHSFTHGAAAQALQVPTGTRTRGHKRLAPAGTRPYDTTYSRSCTGVYGLVLVEEAWAVCSQHQGTRGQGCPGGAVCTKIFMVSRRIHLIRLLMPRFSPPVTPIRTVYHACYMVCNADMASWSWPEPLGPARPLYCTPRSNIWTRPPMRPFWSARPSM